MSVVIPLIVGIIGLLISRKDARDAAKPHPTSVPDLDHRAGFTRFIDKLRKRSEADNGDTRNTDLDKQSHID